MSLVNAPITFCDPKTIDKTPLFGWRFLSPLPADGLTPALQKWGVLHPVLLYQKPEGIFVLDGIRRLDLAQNLGLPEIPVRVFCSTDLPIAAAFLLSIQLNAVSGFNEVEKALILQTAQEIFATQNFPDELWRGLGLGQHQRQDYQDLLRLPPLLRQNLVSQNWPLRVALKFLDFGPDDQNQLAQTLLPWPLNANKLGEILDLLQDLKRREHASASRILQDVLAQLPVSGAPEQKEKQLREQLRQRKNPHYDRQMREFSQTIKPLTAQPHTQIAPTPFFEDDAVEIKSRLLNQNDRRRLIELLQNPAWEKILKG